MKHLTALLPKRRLYLILFIALILIGAFLRLYRIEETLTFQPDQARDAIVVKRMIRNRDLTLLGPGTSVGNMYLGPFYYYFMAPFLALTFPNPVGPAIGVALLNIATVALVWIVAKDILDETAAWFATILYTFWPLSVTFSRFSWNPNIAPFFSLLILYGLYKVHFTRSVRWMFTIWLSFGILVQLHYVALLIAPVMGISLLISLITLKSKRLWVTAIVAAVIGVALTAVPLTFFDLRHNHLVSQAFVDFFTSKQEFLRPAAKAAKVLTATEGRMFLIFSQLLTTVHHVMWDRVISYGLLLLAIICGVIEYRRQKRYGVWLVYGSLATAIVGLGFLTISVFDHYVLYITPMIVLFYGYLGSMLWRYLPGKLVVAAGLIVFTALSLKHGPTFVDEAQMSVTYYQNVANQIYPLVKVPYNIASISESRDYNAMGYRYFLELTDKTPQPYDDIFSLSQLVIVDEMRTPNPLAHPAAIIAHPATYLHTTTHTLPISNGPTVYVVE